MLGDAWQAWWVVLSGTAVAVLLGVLAQAILAQEARAFMPISALGGLGFLVLLGCIILFQGGPLLQGRPLSQGRPLCLGQAAVLGAGDCSKAGRCAGGRLL